MTTPQTQLAETIAALGSPESHMINLLIDRRLVSDHAVTVADIADADCIKAKAWLEFNYDPRMV